METDASPPRSKFEVLEDGISITLPTNRSVLTYFWLVMRLAAWAFTVVMFGAALVQVAAADSISATILLGAGLSILVLGFGSYLLYAALWGFFGIEEFRLTADLLTICNRIRSWERTRTFSTADVRNLRTYLPPEETFLDRSQPRAPHRLVGRVAFDYGAQTFRFFEDIEQLEAEQIVKLILASMATRDKPPDPKRISQSDVTRPSKPRHRIGREDGAMRIILPSKKRPLEIVFLVISLAMGSGMVFVYAYGYFLALRAKIPGLQLFQFCIGSMLLVLLAVLTYTLFSLLWMVFGKETVVFDHQRLFHAREILGLTRKRTFNVSEIKALHIRPVPAPIFLNYYGKKARELYSGGRLAFDYRGKTHRILLDLEEAEADMIADHLRPFLRED